ncbi:hypothetical protein POX_b03048 [Penicillium oxalicum]|uniref:Grh/CP2 DB domain-containing protein n=1 Tax=Penicillium oxalicum (strain 114-2 / CGMCC 5302) TaxID=933388 RepID=S7ZI35_PENO1|nr:hypothetical protein POX_b03048 [Penicillium oxalicum]EPS29934.1 hypothetical protein PDE_04884 [Penicillium oxalicum 114-2]KAI2793002.1 hypothetical protein POX_b03048 [Penicillium oxalicum]
MFRNRNNTQKPDDEFISRFQTTFADIVPRRASQTNASHGNFPPGAGDPMVSDRPMEHHDMKIEEHELKFPSERTPRNLHDLNFTPSWIDPNSMNMMSLAGQHPGFFTPNSGGMGAIFHNQAGDLHTPTAGLNMITPLSLSHSMPMGQHHGPPTINHFNQQYLAQHVPDMHPYVQQQTFAPSAFLHRDSFEAMDESVDGTSIHSLPIDQTSIISASTEYSGALNVSYADGEKFRFNVSLRAPTAMVKHPREVPISYLNKGQAYNLTVMDSNPPMMGSEPLQYRTYVRVSFEEEEQRSKPAACWQLWKEGRGMSESHQRGGKLLAVEYVDSHQGGDDHKHRQISVEHTSFDGFCVTWTANPTTGTPDCSIPVRFNFLSTDFSHSKGVKGIPVRLCAKTELLTPTDESDSPREAEVCYCKVKLFRDHGAERKLSNDVAHVKKTIEKLKQQIAQAEMGGGFGKRKRGSNATANVKMSDRSKTIKHKRTWSMSSQDGQPEKMSLEDDLQAKLVMMQDMFSSTRTMSVLALRGDEEDDPDLFPVRLPTDSESIKLETLSRQNTGASQSMESLILSPTSSNISVNSPQIHESKMAAWKDTKTPTTVPRVANSTSSISTGFIEAVDIDPTYRPPVERPQKPIACFYVRFTSNDEQPDYYRAIYLSERTVRDLMKKISEKNHLDPSRIVRILHVNQNGLRIMVDDDVVRELPEGQDMIVDISESPAPGNEGTNWSPDTPVEIKLTY